MDSEQNSDQPEARTEQQPSPPSPLQPTVPQTEVSQNTQDQPAREQASTRELRREFRWFEIGSLIVNGVLAIIGIFALTIYGGQLDTMNSQLAVMRTTISQTRLALRQATAEVIAENKSADAAKKSADSAQSQAGIMQKQFETADRAWIKVDLAISEALHFANSGMASIGITFTITNVGHSPATNITSVLFAVPIHPPPLMEARLPIEKQKGNCAGAFSAFSGNTSVGEVLFPEQSITSQSRIGVTPKPLPESCCRGFPASYPVWNQYYAVVVGCTDYQFVSSAKHHQTGFVFQVQKKSTPTSFGQPLMIGMDMDIDRIELAPYVLGGRYAN